MDLFDFAFKRIPSSMQQHSIYYATLLKLFSKEERLFYFKDLPLNKLTVEQICELALCMVLKEYSGIAYKEWATAYLTEYDKRRVIAFTYEISSSSTQYLHEINATMNHAAGSARRAIELLYLGKSEKALYEAFYSLQNSAYNDVSSEKYDMLEGEYVKVFVLNGSKELEYRELLRKNCYIIKNKPYYKFD